MESQAMIIDLTKLSGTEIYHTLTQSVVPRPIAWVLSEHENKKINLAPYSYFTAISSVPPLLMYSVGKHKNGQAKDSLSNVQRTKKLVIHIASEDMASDVTKSASPLLPDESELELISDEVVDFDGFELPRLKNCKLAFACTLHQVVEMGETPMSLVFARVEQVYVADDVVSHDAKGRLKINADKVKPLARLGGNEYAALGEIIKV